MCFINPKHQSAFVLKVCTTHGTKEEFEKLVEEKLPSLLEFEVKLNSDARLRWCLEENSPIQILNDTYANNII